MDDARTPDTSRLATAIGVVAAGSVISLATYFAVGGPFGTINDAGNAAIGVLGASLAWQLRRQILGRASGLATAAALVGGAITIVGSTLVISRTTGFLFAGFVSSVGFAGIGAWLVVANRSRLATAWPRRLRRLGLAAGALMIFGLVLVPGIALRLDDPATAPAWVWAGSISWVGTYVAFPAWAIWMGRADGRDATLALSSRVGRKAVTE